MPKKPKSPLRRRATNDLTEDQEMYLIKGICLDGHEPNFGHQPTSPLHLVPFESEEGMKAAWEKNKAHLMTQVNEPFKRPAAFWRYCDPPRRTFKKYYGFGPRGHTYYDSPEGVHGAKVTTIDESEKDYLIRCNLLTGGEREILHSM